MRDLVELGVEDTLQYEPYADSKWQNIFHLDKEPEITPKWGDQYINAGILLPRVDKIFRGQVVCWKCNTNNNPIGRSNQNPILDRRLYEVEFSGEEITELAANVIAESM